MEMEGGIESISRVVAAGESYLGLEVKQLARYLRASWVQVQGKQMRASVLLFSFLSRGVPV